VSVPSIQYHKHTLISVWHHNITDVQTGY